MPALWMAPGRYGRTDSKSKVFVGNDAHPCGCSRRGTISTYLRQHLWRTVRGSHRCHRIGGRRCRDCMGTLLLSKPASIALRSQLSISPTVKEVQRSAERAAAGKLAARSCRQELASEVRES